MCLDRDGNGSEWKDLVRGEHGVMRGRDVDEKTRRGWPCAGGSVRGIKGKESGHAGSKSDQARIKIQNTHTQKNMSSNMCWLWMKRLLCCQSHILYTHAKTRAATTNSEYLCYSAL